MIEFKNVVIGYQSRELVTIPKLLLEPNNLYVLIGRNGSGKSTLLRTLTNQGALISGNILLNGDDIRTYNNTTISRKVSFVQTKFPSVEYLKVGEYVALGRSPFTNAFGRLSANDNAIINKAISLLGIDHIKDKFTSEISDGERQLTAIAKALAQETDVILLDEPTAFLDYTNKKIVFNILSKIANDMNKCILLSSHDLELSIESGCSFLLRESSSTKLLFGNTEITKEEILKISF